MARFVGERFGEHLDAACTPELQASLDALLLHKSPAVKKLALAFMLLSPEDRAQTGVTIERARQFSARDPRPSLPKPPQTLPQPAPALTPLRQLEQDLTAQPGASAALLALLKQHREGDGVNWEKLLAKDTIGDVKALAQRLQGLGKDWKGTEIGKAAMAAHPPRRARGEVAAARSTRPASQNPLSPPSRIEPAPPSHDDLLRMATIQDAQEKIAMVGRVLEIVKQGNPGAVAEYKAYEAQPGSERAIAAAGDAIEQLCLNGGDGMEANVDGILRACPGGGDLSRDALLVARAMAFRAFYVAHLNRAIQSKAA